MCGISGIYHYANEEPINQSVLRRMTEVLVHRGPDDEGFFLDRHVGLGHRRLSVIDIAGGRQPIVNEDGAVAIVSDGEIYNYLDLAHHVGDRGHRLLTQSDTEAIIHLYEEYGESCVTMLRGTFAFAIWDARKNVMMLARDRIGEKPLYYADHEGRLIFGSELKSVIANPQVPRAIDEEALSDYFTFGYIPAPKTIFRAVRKLQAGHYLLVTSNGIQDREYWDIDFDHPDERSQGIWSAAILESFCRSVGLQLISETPLGVSLSGGAGSSAVAAAVREITSEPVVTVSVGFTDQEQNEIETARWFANQLGSDHRECSVETDPVTVLEKLGWHYDEPFADPSAITAFSISQAAREFLTVVLSGQDGEQNFGGYRRLVLDAIGESFRERAPAILSKPLLKVLSTVSQESDWLFNRWCDAKGLRNIPLDHAAAYLHSVYGSQEDRNPEILGRGVRAQLNGYDPFEAFIDRFKRPRTNDPVARVRYLDLKTFLTDSLLVKIDRASMAVSLQVRSPLLDHQFMGLVARIPSPLKLQGRSENYIFRRAVSKLLPREVLSRRAKGPVIPVADWLRGDLYNLSNSLLFDSSSYDGLVDRAVVAKLWKEHQAKSGDNSRSLWSILMFRMWQRNFEHG